MGFNVQLCVDVIKKWGCVYMFLTGYHGTTAKSAEGIIKDDRFNHSKSDIEWLGEGIYFYFDFSDAYNWRDTEAVIHSIIKVPDDEYLDMNTPAGKRLFDDVAELLKDELEREIDQAEPDAIQKNQCAIMKSIWDKSPSISVISASFPVNPKIMKTMFESRKLRREFCVRNNSFIKCKHLIRKGDLE